MDTAIEQYVHEDGDPAMPYAFGDECDYADEWDEYEMPLQDCHYSPEHGFCLSIGSEFCDWDCPIMRVAGAHPTGEDFADKGEVSNGV